ncbi:uncharacterized protein TNCV_4286241 [Trichonephila clavipes]|nr:uncharacterized protein TNCV_4286241 [Trichonephila clavipes]
MGLDHAMELAKSRIGSTSKKVSRKKKLSLQEALDLLQNLPSESSDALIDDSSDEDVPAVATRDFVTRTIVRFGRYLSHWSYEAVANSWLLCQLDAISNKIPPRIKMDRLKFKLEIVETLAASPPTNKSILTHEDNSVVAAIRHISHSCLDPNEFTVLNCIVKGHASLSPPSLRLRLCSRFTLLAT